MAVSARSSRRLALALAVAVSLLLAGCGAGATGLGDSGDRDAGNTVAPALRGTPTVSPTPERPAYPPGVSADGVNVSVLAAAHRAALEEGPVDVRWSTRVVSDTGETVIAAHFRSRSADGTQLYEADVTEMLYDPPGNRTYNRTYWRADGVIVERSEFENGTAAVDVSEGGYPPRRVVDRTGAATLVGVVGAYDFEYGGTVRRGGERLHLVTADAVAASYVPSRSNVSVRLLVTDDGVVRAFSVSYVTERYGSLATVRRRFTVETENVSVPKPEWVREALANRSEANSTATDTASDTDG